MKKIVCIIGTRPQLIKHSVLLKVLRKSFIIETLNSHQHYSYELNELLHKDLFENEQFNQLELSPNLTNAARLGEMIIKIDSFLQESKPDAVIVYGDTDTTLAGSLAANKGNYCLIHIEAGERSGNLQMPEEHNRIIADSLSTILFCSSQAAMKNLKLYESVKQIVYSGDIMKDLVLEKSSSISKPPINEEYIYCTIHRNYNQNNPEKLKELLDMLQLLNTRIVFPVHPATIKTIELSGIDVNNYFNIHFQLPFSYTQSIHYQKFAKAVITDSGGIQKEAYWLKRPCFTIRKETEWTETLIGGWNHLLYNNLFCLQELIQKKPDENTYTNELYGNGNACGIIQKSLLSLLN